MPCFKSFKIKNNPREFFSTRNITGRRNKNINFMIRIAVIIGSTRPHRKAEAVAKWFYEIARKRTDAEFELVDIMEYDLPLLDEPISPSHGKYLKDHTLKWAAKI